MLVRRLDGKRDCAPLMPLHKLPRLCQADAQIYSACSSQDKPGMEVPWLLKDATSHYGMTCLSLASPYLREWD